MTANVLDINEGGKPAAMLGLEKGRGLFYSAAGWSSLLYQLESCTKWLLFNEVFSNELLALIEAKEDFLLY